MLKQATAFAVATCITLLLVLSPTTPRAEALPKDIKDAVTFIFLADENGGPKLNPKTGQPMPYGTGFFAALKAETDPSRSVVYLVTAKHVLHAADGTPLKSIFLRLNLIGGKSAEFVRIDLDKTPAYTSPDESVDIAVIQILPDTSRYQFKSVPDEMIPSSETFPSLNISEGSDVFFEGLFSTYYGNHVNSPIARFGRVAMLPPDCITWPGIPPAGPSCAQLYLLEVQSWGGNSGSPVFFYIGSELTGAQIKLAGIMRGFFNADAPMGVIDVPTTPFPVLIPNSGIAAVTPSYLLHDILHSDALTKGRADLIEKERRAQPGRK